MSDEQSLIKKVYLWIKENISIILSCGIAFLFVIFILVMYSSHVACIFMNSTGITDKPELLEFIGWGMGGFIATLGAVGLLRRAAEFSEQNKLTEKGHIHERFKAATEHLSNVESASGRIASFYEFYRLAEITAKMPEEKGLKETIFDLLCAHLRQTTKEKDYKNNFKLTEEVQSLLDILFKPKNKNILIFSGLEANLAETNLQGVNLQGANLQEADLQEANLQGANLEKANLQYANLEKANLQGADLRDADLQYANLRDANLQYAKMQGAKMQYAKMQYAKMQGADLREAYLQYANLREANLQGANLEKANLQGANLEKAKMQGAKMQYANLQYAKMQGADLREAYLQYANLRGVDLLRAKINIATTVMPDNWKDVVKLYENEDGKKTPMVVVMNSKGEVDGRY